MRSARPDFIIKTDSTDPVYRETIRTRVAQSSVGRQPVDLEDADVQFLMPIPDEDGMINEEVDIVDAEAGEVEVRLPGGIPDGNYDAEFRVDFDDGETLFWPQNRNLFISVRAGTDRELDPADLSAPDLTLTTLDVETVNAETINTEQLNNVHVATTVDEINDKIEEAGEGGSIYVVPGVYEPTPEDLPFQLQDHQELFGHPGSDSGKGGTRIIAEETDGPIIRTSDTEGCRVHDFYIQGDVDDGSCRHVDVHTTYDTKVWNIMGVDTGDDTVRIDSSEKVEVWNIHSENFGDDGIDVTDCNNVRVRNVEGYTSRRFLGLETGGAGAPVEVDDGSYDVQVDNVYGDEVETVLEVHTSAGRAFPSDIQASNIKGVNSGLGVVRLADRWDVEDGSVAENIQITNVQATDCEQAVVIEIGGDEGSESTLRNVQITNVQGTGFELRPIQIEVGEDGIVEDVEIDGINLSNIDTTDSGREAIRVESYGHLEGLTLDGLEINGEENDNEDGVHIRARNSGTISDLTVNGRVRGFGDNGVIIEEAEGVCLDINSSDNNTRGVELVECTDLEATMIVKNNGFAGAEIEDCEEGAVRGLAENNDRGVWDRGNARLSFVGLSVINNDGHGLRSSDGAEATNIVGGTYRDNADPDIDIRDASNIRIDADYDSLDVDTDASNVQEADYSSV